MDINPTVIFNAVVLLVVLGLMFLLVRRSQAADPNRQLSIFEYGQLLIQAFETAKIIVQGVQEAWRTGEIEDDEREEDAVEKMVDLFPQLNEDDLRRSVKAAVYWMRQVAGKELGKMLGDAESAHGS